MEPTPIEPLLIDPRFLRPLPKSLFRSACNKCDRRQAMWEMGPEKGDKFPVCALCFLYCSQWGKQRVDAIHEIVQAVETESGEKFLRDADGRTLISPKDGDRILAAIALTSRMFQTQDRMQAMAAAVAEGAPPPESPPVEVPPETPEAT